MLFTIWFIVIGVLLITVALAGSLLKKLPLTSSMFYLVLGVGLGPAGFGLFDIHAVNHAALVERFAEVAVIVSLFTAGLKLRLPLSDRRWIPPLMLAVVAMTLTVGAIALIGYAGLGLPIGAAIVLGAVLAPTDPVLASDVQVTHARDEESVRFSVTGEAGLNDGTAFPFIMLGLGLLGVHEIGSWGTRWVLVDLLWAVIGGLGTGALFGTAVGHLELRMRQSRHEASGLDDFLALGLIASSYGAALLIHAYGFLAVFAAGLALRRIERREEERSGESGAGGDVADAGEEEASGSTHARMAAGVLGFNEQLERLGEVAVVILVGGMLAHISWRDAAWFVALLLLVVRPATVFLTLARSDLTLLQRSFVGWFGVKGVGSIYYLAYAITHGIPADQAERLADLTLAVVTVSVVVHGISVTPLMTWYERLRER